MTLGERIRALRQGRGMSQEALAEALGVSRQAVSKWEKNLSYPDTENLLSLAELFGVSADELALLRRQESQGEAPPPPEAAGTEEGPPPEAAQPSSPRRRGWVPAALVLAALLIVTIPAAVYFALRRSETGSVEPVEKVPGDVGPAGGQSGGEEVPPVSQGAETEFGEFALLWQGEGGSEHLALGKQAEYFPFGTSLAPTEPEEAGHVDTYGELHGVDCGDLKLQYFRWEEESGPVESVYEITTIVPGYGTPRGIQVGSRETEVLEAYGDELIYHLKEDSYTVAPHDDYYTYTAMDVEGGGGFQEIAFFIQKGEVAALRLRLLLDVGFEGPDNLYSFPVVDGEPDFSARREPEREEIDETRTVYIALHALRDQTNLSAEEVYQYRRDIYGNLQYISWWGFGGLGEAGKRDATILELLYWLNEQDTLSEDEIYGLQAGGCLRTDLDGAYAERYSGALCRAFARYPVEYIHVLADRDFTDAEREAVISSTVFAAPERPDQFQAAVEELEHGLMINTAQSRWQRAFLHEVREQFPDGIAV